MSIRAYEHEICRYYDDTLNDIDLSKPLKATLKEMFWGKSANLILCFMMEDQRMFKISVFYQNAYSSRDNQFCFRNELLLETDILLTLTRSKKGYLNIQSATLYNMHSELK